MGRLSGKTALVIGGGTGIGAAVCGLFAREGAAVAVGDLPGSEAARELAAWLGGIDVPADGAGFGGRPRPPREEPRADRERVIVSNLLGDGLQEALSPTLRRR